LEEVVQVMRDCRHLERLGFKFHNRFLEQMVMANVMQAEVCYFAFLVFSYCDDCGMYAAAKIRKLSLLLHDALKKILYGAPFARP